MCPSGSWIRTNAKQLLSQGYEPCMLPLHYPAINSTSSWIQTNDPRIHTTLCYHSLTRFSIAYVFSCGLDMSLYHIEILASSNLIFKLMINEVSAPPILLQFQLRYLPFSLYTIITLVSHLNLHCV